jgi:cbb3-type cytochrome oxidase subunit 3
MSIVLRSIITVLMFGSFIALWFWAWRRENKPSYDAAARLPLDDQG